MLFVHCPAAEGITEEQIEQVCKRIERTSDWNAFVQRVTTKEGVGYACHGDCAAAEAKRAPRRSDRACQGCADGPRILEAEDGAQLESQGTRGTNRV